MMYAIAFWVKPLVESDPEIPQNFACPATTSQYIFRICLISPLTFYSFILELKLDCGRLGLCHFDDQYAPPGRYERLLFRVTVHTSPSTKRKIHA